MESVIFLNYAAGFVLGALGLLVLTGVIFLALVIYYEFKD